jgi:outer membrane biosynthesis protein TonB
MDWMRPLVRIAVLVVMAAGAGGASGCALLHARASTPAPGPALAAPSAPPHDVPPPSPTPIEPASPTVLPTPPPPTEPAVVVPRERPPAPAPPAAVAEPPEPAPETAAPVPPPTLQTTPDVDAAIRRVRTVLDQANRDLNRVNYGSLGADLKTQYATARRFVQQAEGALTDRNVAYAGQLAEKAAALAAVLPKS